MSIHPLSPPPRHHYDPPSSPTASGSGKQRSLDATKHPSLNGHHNLQSRLTAIESELKELNKVVTKRFDQLRHDVGGQNVSSTNRVVKHSDSLRKLEDQNEEILGKTDTLEARILKVEDMVSDFRAHLDVKLTEANQRVEEDGRGGQSITGTTKTEPQDDISCLPGKVHTIENRMQEQFSLMNANFVELFRRLDSRRLSQHHHDPSVSSLPTSIPSTSAPPTSTPTSTSSSAAPSAITIVSTISPPPTTASAASASAVTVVAPPKPLSPSSAELDVPYDQPTQNTEDPPSTEQTVNLTEDLVDQFDARLQHVQGSLEQTQSSVNALSGLVTLLKHAKSKMSLKTSKSKRRNRN